MYKSDNRRRTFIKKSALILASAGTGSVLLSKSVSAQKKGNKEKFYDNFPPAEKLEKREAMFIALRKCTGCHTCAVACRQENNMHDDIFWSWVKVVEKGKYPHIKVLSLPLSVLVYLVFSLRLCHIDSPFFYRIQYYAERNLLVGLA